MRLSLKIALAILLGVALLLSLHSYQSVHREREVLKDNLSREARQVGQMLRVMLGDIWQYQGEKAAQAFLKRTNQLNADLQVRWIWPEDTLPEPTAPRVQKEKLAPVVKGETLTLIAEADDGRDFLLTYIPMRVQNDRVGAIEISESLEGMHGYVRESMQRSALLMAAIVASSLLLMVVVGSFWVSRPVQRLAEQADRIASGDFSTAVDLRGRDEIAVLAAALDRMRGQLASARDADKARLEALEKLRHTERLATLGRLSAGMAHELGTPLNVVAGRAKLIASQNLAPEEVEKSARIIGEQAERMTALMRQLLDFARRGSPRKVSVDLARIAANSLDMLRPIADKQKVKLTLVPTEKPLAVAADGNQLQQVLLNLVMNGIQAMPEGGNLAVELLQMEQVQPPEALETAPGPCAVLRVSDEGIGISEEHLDHLFDPFFTTKDVGQGSGLGLSIAYGIVQEHGGWISVDSRPGSGSRFSVFLPLGETSAELGHA